MRFSVVGAIRHSLRCQAPPNRIQLVVLLPLGILWRAVSLFRGFCSVRFWGGERLYFAKAMAVFEGRAFRKLIVLAVFVLLFASLACFGDDPAPVSQPTAEPTATRAPEVATTLTVAPSPTVTAVSPGDGSETAGGLAGPNMDDPQVFLSGLSVDEQSCLSDSGIGVSQVMAAMTSAGSSEEGDAIIDCLGEETLLRMFLSELLIAPGDLSAETSDCIRDGLGGLSLRSLLKSGGADAELDDEIAGLASFLTVTACLEDGEWEAAAPVLGLGPRDESGTDCLLAELGGPTGLAEALLRTDESGLPTAFIAATNKCGVGFTEMPGDSGPGDVGGDSTEDMALPPDRLVPFAVDDPQAFLSGLSPREQSCLGDKGIGPEELLQMTGRSPGSSPETTADIVNCLQDDTVLRLFLTTLVGQVEPFSEETSLCIREGFVPIDLRGLLAPAIAFGSPASSLAMSMAALNVSVVCMNDEEWAIYSPRLGMQPEDKEGAACLFDELGGPEQVVKAMQEASLGETPEGLTEAFNKCGLEEDAPTYP